MTIAEFTVDRSGRLVPTDDLPRQIEAVVTAIIHGDPYSADDAIAELAKAPPFIRSQRRPAAERCAQIFMRDRFCCLYCGRKTVLTQVMGLLGRVLPNVFPFDANWKGGKTHPAVITYSPTVDHKVPVAWGGDWNADHNLVTACGPCNASKRDFTLEELGWPPPLDPPEWEWDGLRRLYRPLWEAAGRPRLIDERKPNGGRHEVWLRALGC